MRPEQINTLISEQYPQLEQRFRVSFPSIDFAQIKSQLGWSLNNTELTRGLHRLHCFLDASSIQIEHYELLESLNATQKEAVLAMLLIDSCKGSTEAIEAYTKPDRAPAKDSVAFFFDTLAKAPEIYPIFNAISEEAQQYLKDNIFYLHCRHLQLGEVPAQSLSEFQALITNEFAGKTQERLMLQKAFWLVNWMGFDAHKLSVTDSKKAENFGSTATKDQIRQYHQLHQHLLECADMGSLEPLSNFYLTQIPDGLSNTLRETGLGNSVKVFVGRLLALLQMRQSSDDALNIINSILATENGAEVIAKTASAESQVYETLKLQAITFLPAVYWKLQEINEDKTPTEILSIYLKFQTAFFAALPEVKEQLKDNLVVPLFGIGQDTNSILTNFSKHADYALRLNIEIGKFMTVNAKAVAPKAQPQASKKQDNGDSDIAPSRSPKI